MGFKESPLPPSCSASLQEILQQGYRGREHCTCPLQVFVITTKNVSLCVSKCPLSSWKSPLESLCPTSLRCSLRLCCTVAKNLCPMMPFFGFNQLPIFNILSSSLRAPRFLLPGGGVLSIFVRRGCAVFQGIVFAYFF